MVDIVIADEYMDAAGSVFVSCTITNNADAAVDVVPIFYAEEYYLDDYGDYVLADELFDMCTEFSWDYANTPWDSDEFLVISNAPDYIEPGETRTVKYALTSNAYLSESDYSRDEPYLDNFSVELFSVSYSSEGTSSHPANQETDVLLELEYVSGENDNGVYRFPDFNLTGSITNLTDSYLSEISLLVIVNNLSDSEVVGDIFATYNFTYSSLKPGESIEVSECEYIFWNFTTDEFWDAFYEAEDGLDYIDSLDLNYELSYIVDYVIDADKMESISE